MTTTRQLRDLFIQALGLPPETDFDSLSYRAVPEWDSVAHMALVARLEATYAVMLDTDDVIDLSSFQACKRILGQHGVAFDD